MRVMYLSASGEVGGAERSLLDILASIRAAQPSWPLALMAGSEGPLVGHASRLGVAARVLPFPPALSRLGEAGVETRGGRGLQFAAQMARAVVPVARYRRALTHALREFHPDVIHSNGLTVIESMWAAAHATWWAVDHGLALDWRHALEQLQQPLR